jgi:hypothetical protein
MKSTLILGSAVLFNLSMLAACGGVSNIGSSSSEGGQAGSGMAGSKAMNGSKAGGAAGTVVDSKAGSNNMEVTDDVGPSEGGAASEMTPGNGTGARPSMEQSRVDLDCLGIGADCKFCTAGGLACQSFCVSGQCQAKPSTCPVQCSTDQECGLPCVECSPGHKACAQSTCKLGVCQTSKPICETQSCDGLGCGTPCTVCDGKGGCQTGLSFCNADGKCEVGPPNCAPSMCATAMDCGTPPPICQPCTDGSCARFDCVGNQCAFACPSGAALQCKYTEDCPAQSGPCTPCPSGKCAVQACLTNACQLVCPVN